MTSERVVAKWASTGGISTHQIVTVLANQSSHTWWLMWGAAADHHRLSSKRRKPRGQVTRRSTASSPLTKAPLTHLFRRSLLVNSLMMMMVVMVVLVAATCDRRIDAADVAVSVCVLSRNPFNKPIYLFCSSNLASNSNSAGLTSVDGCCWRPTTPVPFVVATFSGSSQAALGRSSILAIKTIT